jgi:hypothetical protein
MADLNTTISIMTLNAKVLNNPSGRQRLQEWIKKQIQYILLLKHIFRLKIYIECKLEKKMHTATTETWNGYNNIRKINFKAKILLYSKKETFYNDKRADSSRRHNN